MSKQPWREHVVAMDPGGRSGWAAAKMGPDYLKLTGTGVLRQDLMADWFATQQGIIAPKGYQPKPRTFDVAVIEAWRPRRINGSMDWIEGSNLISAQHVGQLRWIARTSGAKIVMYEPAQKDGFVASMPPLWLSLDQDSNEQHDQDARMHLWGYFFDEWFSATQDPEGLIHGVQR